jgi:hypothetical protein
MQTTHSHVAAICLAKAGLGFDSFACVATFLSYWTHSHLAEKQQLFDRALVSPAIVEPHWLCSALMRAASAFPVMASQQQQQQQQLLHLSSTTSGKSELLRHLHSPITALSKKQKSLSHLVQYMQWLLVLSKLDDRLIAT